MSAYSTRWLGEFPADIGDQYFGEAPCGCERYRGYSSISETACFCDEHNQDVAPWFAAAAIVNGMRAIDSWPAVCFREPCGCWAGTASGALARQAHIPAGSLIGMVCRQHRPRDLYFGIDIAKDGTITDTDGAAATCPGFPYTPPPNTPPPKPATQPDTLPAPAPDEPEVHTPRLPVGPSAPPRLRTNCYYCRAPNPGLSHCWRCDNVQPPGGE